MTAGAAPRTERWLFSPRIDVLAFGGSAALALLLVAVGGPLGLLDPATGDTPEWAWIACVLLVDVAHVWGNLLLVYGDPAELRRRPAIYAGVPLASAALLVALATESEAWLWRAVAYLAVIHFVRQQVGWVKLYRARARSAPDARRPDEDRWGRLVDEGAVYAATVAPVVWWHANLPQAFAWLAPGDFFGGLPSALGDVALAVDVAWLLAYGARSVRARRRGAGQPGKDLVVGSTALLWWLGIVALRSDYAFTVTNVLIHGIPYVVLIAWTARRRGAAALSLPAPLARPSRGAGLGAALALAVTLVALLWSAALVEETLWDALVWQERPWLAGLRDLVNAPEIGSTARAVAVALLVLPQVTHYILDGVMWRRRDNPVLAAELPS